MSRTYRVCDRGELLAVGVVFAVIGVLAALFVGCSILELPPFYQEGEDDGRGLGVIFGLAICGGCAFRGWQYVNRPWRITIDPPDVLTFHRALRPTRVRLGDVVGIERRGRFVPHEDEDSRVLAIEHRRGTISVVVFPTVEDFLADVRTVNPSVWIGGAWETRFRKRYP